MAQDQWTLQEKKQEKLTRNRRTGRLCRPVLQLPTGQSCSLQTVGSCRSWRTWNEQGQKQNEQTGATVEEGSGHGKGEMAAGKQSPQNKAAAGEHSRQMICPAQASKKQNSQQTLADLAAKQQLPDDVGRPLAVQCR